ncbi:uncharacterized protein LOC128257400 isoform X2 [Drosophila gunungcola]|uniref:uncharacterized protein LOC128257400 isoform X2 n=1 Tax=Drosophila gunungcola TaxID=103775 RepID=UPI0022E7B430|nr:uncharacterized protein LOC128257400 isoform X2 [Drosophila gunungcola]
MSNNHIFRYVIFGLGLFYTCATFDKNKARCKDCTGYNKERCPIEGDSGYYVAISSRKLKSMKDTSKGNPLTDDLDVCIPSSMNVDVAGGTFQYICIWSSELGCQLILPESDSTTDCSICRAGLHASANIGEHFATFPLSRKCAGNASKHKKRFDSTVDIHRTAASIALEEV